MLCHFWDVKINFQIDGNVNNKLRSKENREAIKTDKEQGWLRLRWITRTVLKFGVFYISFIQTTHRKFRCISTDGM